MLSFFVVDVDQKGLTQSVPRGLSRRVIQALYERLHRAMAAAGTTALPHGSENAPDAIMPAPETREDTAGAAPEADFDVSVPADEAAAPPGEGVKFRVITDSENSQPVLV